jgi:hypothetical protein
VCGFGQSSESNLAPRYSLTSSLTHHRSIFHALFNTYSG